MAHVAAISADTGEVRRLTDIKGPLIYQVASLAWDPKGRVLFYTTDNGAHRDLVSLDPATGQMLSGIGDYGYTPMPGDRRILSRCDTPYPCDFDRGVLFGFALIFEKGVRIEHEPGPCRNDSFDSCTYVISW